MCAHPRTPIRTPPFRVRTPFFPRLRVYSNITPQTRRKGSARMGTSFWRVCEGWARGVRGVCRPFQSAHIPIPSVRTSQNDRKQPDSECAHPFSKCAHPRTSIRTSPFRVRTSFFPRLRVYSNITPQTRTKGCARMGTSFWRMCEGCARDVRGVCEGCANHFRVRKRTSDHFPSVQTHFGSFSECANALRCVDSASMIGSARQGRPARRAQ